MRLRRTGITLMTVLRSPHWVKVKNPKALVAHSNRLSRPPQNDGQPSRATPRKIGGGNSGFRCLSKLADAYFAVVAV